MRTHLGVELKPAVGGEHHDRRGSEGVFRGQQYPEVVQAALKFRAWCAADGAVPFLEG